MKLLVLSVFFLCVFSTKAQDTTQIQKENYFLIPTNTFRAGHTWPKIQRDSAVYMMMFEIEPVVYYKGITFEEDTWGIFDSTHELVFWFQAFDDYSKSLWIRHYLDHIDPDVRVFSDDQGMFFGARNGMRSQSFDSVFVSKDLGDMIDGFVMDTICPTFPKEVIFDSNLKRLEFVDILWVEHVYLSFDHYKSFVVTKDGVWFVDEGDNLIFITFHALYGRDIRMDELWKLKVDFDFNTQEVFLETPNDRFWLFCPD